jgi:hypothetical protein
VRAEMRSEGGTGLSNVEMRNEGGTRSSKVGNKGANPLPSLLPWLFIQLLESLKISPGIYVIYLRIIPD